VVDLKISAGVLTAIVIVVLLIGVVSAGTIVYFYLKMKGTGSIKGVGVEVYADASLSQKISAVNWGAIAPGGSSTVTVYIKSVSTVPITLSFITDNWSPSQAADFLSMTWTYEGQTINPQGALQVSLVMHVAEGISGIQTFSVDITIVAQG
jgi:hypothetical protein